MEWVLFAALVGAALIGTFYVMARASKGYDKARERREGGYPVRHCSTCKSRMDYSGLNTLGSEELTLETYKCPTCRKVEFFLPPAALE